MNTGFGGVAETLSLDLGGRRLQVVLERRGPATASTWLLLPALSTVSSRSEWQPLAAAVADRCQLVSFDWPGFGDSDRPCLDYDADLLRSALRSILSYLYAQNRTRLTVVAAGHSASIALALATEWSGQWRRLVAVAPTWRGPLPTMTGWSPQRFGWLRGLVGAPLIGPALYRLNTSRAVLGLMLRRHVWVERSLLTPERLLEQQQLARRRGARFASAAFVSGGLDPAEDRAWWLEQAQRLQ
jgi:pimeloyl-ACP methyl ester carboxylesterase